MGAYTYTAVLLALVVVGCGPSGICDVTAGDLAGTYELVVTKENDKPLTVELTFSDSGVDLVEVGKTGTIHCATGTTAFCALDIKCADKDGRPKFRFLWTGEGQ